MCTESTERRYLPNSHGCFVCGEDNHAGLKTRFFVEGDLVKAELHPQQHHWGYENVVHGGIVAAILDECMAWAAARAMTRMCVTAELNVRYIKSAPTDRPLIAETRVIKAHRMMTTTEGALRDAEGTEYARATAKFMPLSAEETLRVDDALNYQGGEERVFDGLRGGEAPAR